MEDFKQAERWLMDGERQKQSHLPEDAVVSQEQYDAAHRILDTTGSLTIYEMCDLGLNPKQAAAVLENMMLNGRVHRDAEEDDRSPVAASTVEYGRQSRWSPTFLRFQRVALSPDPRAFDPRKYDQNAYVKPADTTWIKGNLHEGGKIRPYKPAYNLWITPAQQHEQHRQHTTS